MNHVRCTGGRVEYRNEAGQLHNENGPAIVRSGTVEYWINGSCRAKWGRKIILP